jgi:hypothetical protein
MTGAPTPFPRRTYVASEDETAVFRDEKCAGCGADCAYREERTSKHVVRLHLPEGWTHVQVYGGKRVQNTKTCRGRPMRQILRPVVACPACSKTTKKDVYGDVMDAPFLRAAQRAVGR